nr:hypothetical protein CFP56_54532 [Quercus suber]
MVVDECDSTMGCDSNHDYGLHVLITLLMFPKLRRKHWHKILGPQLATGKKDPISIANVKSREAIRWATEIGSL